MATIREQLAEQAQQIADLRAEVAGLRAEAFILRTVGEVLGRPAAPAPRPGRYLSLVKDC